MTKASLLLVAFEFVVTFFVSTSSVHAQLGRYDEADSECYPDPHFRTWDNVYYDWHGGCDVVLVKNDDIHVHVRTQVTAGYSYIKGVAIGVGYNLGFDRLELYVSDINQDLVECTINSKPCYFPIDFVGSYPLFIANDTDVATHVPVYYLMLDENQYVRVHKYGNSLSVYMRGNGLDFFNTRGMSGRWNVKNYPYHLRDGNTTTDPTALALSWQVGVDPINDPDPILFQRHAGLTVCEDAIVSQKCVARNDTKTCPVCQQLPGTVCCPKSEFETCPTVQEIQHACADIVDDNARMNCVFDISTTGNVEEWLKSPYYYPSKYPHLSYTCETPSSCKRKAGGKCVTGCRVTGGFRCSTKYGCDGACRCRFEQARFPIYNPMGRMHYSVLNSLSVDPTFPSICSSKEPNSNMAGAAANYSIEFYKQNSEQYNPGAVRLLTYHSALKNLYGIQNVKSITGLGRMLIADEYSGISVKDTTWFEKLEKAGRQKKPIKSLKDFENILIHEDDIDELVRGALLTGSAVYRYSFKYWAKVSKRKNHKWYEIHKRRSKKDKRWWMRGVVGAIHGFVKGFPGDGLSGGLLGGALAASAASCLE